MVFGWIPGQGLPVRFEKSLLAFRCLMLGFSDGVSSTKLDFRRSDAATQLLLTGKDSAAQIAYVLSRGYAWLAD